MIIKKQLDNLTDYALDISAIIQNEIVIKWFPRLLEFARAATSEGSCWCHRGYARHGKSDWHDSRCQRMRLSLGLEPLGREEEP